MDQDRPGWNPPPAPSFEPTSPSTPDVVASSGPRRSRVGTGIAIAAIGIGALGIAGTAYASSSSPSPSPSDGRPGYGTSGGSGAQPSGRPGAAGPRRDGDGGHRGGGLGMGMGPGMGFGGALHGSFVTAKQGGGFQTVDMQRGTVTGVSATSITVTSADGFTATYTVGSTTLVHAQRDGIGSVKAGDEVAVSATESGSEKTATGIVDLTQVGAQRGGPGGMAPAPKPTSTA